MHYVLQYNFVEGYMERRAPLRNTHLTLAWEAKNRGELVLAGAFAEPADGAMFIFDADSPGVAERFAKADPYVTNGLVREWRVRPWTTVIGDLAKTPVHPTS
jgi:uncharacterized protein YciI